MRRLYLIFAIFSSIAAQADDIDPVPERFFAKVPINPINGIRAETVTPAGCGDAWHGDP